ncbi:MAG: OmpA family protein [Gemmatimonadetes bacterium]|nr:OmpA family protein [Gemmatimonadota bacterium]
MRRVTQFGSAVLFVLMAAACGRKPQPEQAAPPAQNPPATPSQRPGGGNGDEAAARAEQLRRMQASLEEMVFFEYDRAELSQAAQATLNAKLPILRTESGVRLRIDGHADERGSLEYNLALGMRRAQAVREYLTGFGIVASRLAVESFGEDRPLDVAHSESAWSRNRRAEFGVSGLNR